MHGKKRGKIIQFVKFRKPHKADDVVRTSEEIDANPRSKTLMQMPRKHRQSLHHWTFKGCVAPSPFLTEIMRSPVIAPPALRGTAILESGVLAYRRRKNGEVLILLVSKKRSKKWGIPKAESRISELWRDRCQGSIRRGRCHGPDLAEFHWHVSSKKRNSHPKEY